MLAAAVGGTLDISPLVQLRLLQEMTALRVRAVLVADRPGAPQVEAMVTELLGRAADERTGGVAAWYIDSGPGIGPRFG